MNKLTPGQRVFVAVGIDRRYLNLVGVGTYRGEEVPPAGIPGAPMVAHANGNLSGRVDLDDGSVVYRCEAWFGLEADLATDRRKVRPVSLADLRATARGTAPMRRRTNQPGPGFNQTCQDGEVQFEPGNCFPSGHARAFTSPGISVWAPDPDPPGYVAGILGGRRCMALLTIAPRDGKLAAGAWLSRTELGELIGHLNAVHAAMEDVP